MAMMKAVRGGNFEEAASILQSVMTPANKMTIEAITELVKYQVERCSFEVQGHPDGKPRPCASHYWYSHHRHSGQRPDQCDPYPQHHRAHSAKHRCRTNARRR
jgi:hypothetical protein